MFSTTALSSSPSNTSQSSISLLRLQHLTASIDGQGPGG